MKNKILIFDASSLITLGMNGITFILEDLKKKFNVKFIIPEKVKYEIIDRPHKIKRFKLEALIMKRLFDNKILQLPSSLGINKNQLDKKTSQILSKTNHSYFAKGKFMEIIHKGEAACLALSLILSEKNIENIIVVDERTTRMIGENPKNLIKLFNKKLHTKVELKSKLKEFSKIRFIRSSELVIVAYKNNFFNLKDGVLDALLYATKFKGNSISSDEIREAKKLKI